MFNVLCIHRVVYHVIVNLYIKSLTIDFFLVPILIRSSNKTGIESDDYL